MGHKYKAVIFDLDGTLIDSADLIRDSFRFASNKALGKVINDNILLKNVGTPLKSQMEKINSKKTEELVTAYKEYNRKMHDRMVRNFPGMKNVLKKLEKEGIELGIVTSKGEELTVRALQLLGMTEFFKVIVTADDVKVHKPEPEPVNVALKEIKIKKGSAIYIGDSPVDIRAGKAAGLETAAVLWGMFSKETLRKEHPDFYLEKPEEILKIILDI